MGSPATADGDRFAALFDQYAPRVFAYVRRHVMQGAANSFMAFRRSTSGWWNVSISTINRESVLVDLARSMRTNGMGSRP